ncbi:hypothetical protein [Micromonospora craniellae]|uniref:Uncharacterized protein n=1 Tax=Micromonospora craniellae TaxID=2294034 RepID=A0A372FT93_9ACTN|nr:hypothetical protein [Micromonospora craniellae]QOC94739.1 hypothetical protein ID554_15030 [Micromonospora craniellae]RFS43729.1 hypothetical protein D0Q02_26210 [Micromonospora craniellae]
MTSAAPDLRTRLIDLYGSCAASVAGKLGELGLPPMEAATGYAVVRAKDSWSVESYRTARSPLHDYSIERRHAPWVTPADVQALGQVAEALLTEHSSTLPFYSPSGGRNWPLIRTADDAGHPPDFAVDGPDWVARMLIYPALRHHLIRGDAVTETAARFADEVLDVAADTALRYRTQSPLVNVVTTDGGPLTVGTVTVRMLDGVEQHQWYPNNPDYRMWRTGSATAEPPTALLEITSIGPRNNWFFPPRESVERLLLALALHGHEVGASIAAGARVPAWHGSGRWSSPIQAPVGSKDPVTLTVESLTDAVTTARHLDDRHIAAPGNTHDLALHRFQLGIARAGSADAIVDFTVALEALLLPYDADTRHGDLSSEPVKSTETIS